MAIDYAAACSVAPEARLAGNIHTEFLDRLPQK
jgi:hypothetical protein